MRGPLAQPCNIVQGEAGDEHERPHHVIPVLPHNSFATTQANRCTHTPVHKRAKVRICCTDLQRTDNNELNRRARLTNSMHDGAHSSAWEAHPKPMLREPQRQALYKSRNKNEKQSRNQLNSHPTVGRQRSDQETPTATRYRHPEEAARAKRARNSKIPQRVQVPRNDAIICEPNWLRYAHCAPTAT